MKLNKFLIPALAFGLALASCDKDGDMITTAGPDKAELESSGKNIVLSIDHLQDLALTVYWNENGDITLSDPRVEAPSPAVSNAL